MSPATRPVERGAPGPCPTCLRYARLLVIGSVDETTRRAAIRELAAHLTDHAEGRAA